MNCFVHLIAFDLRRLCWQTVLLLVVQLAVTLNSLQPDTNPDVQSLLQIGLPFLLSAIWVSLIASTAQSYPAFAPNAFWYTRPISAVRLMATRIVTALTLAIALPALLHLVVLISLGLTFGAAIDVCAGLACALALCVTPLLLLATLAEKFFRFWLLLLGGTTALSLAVAQIRFPPPDSVTDNVSSRVALSFLLLVIGSVGILWRAYTHRSLTRSFLQTVALCAIVVTAALTWRWQLPFLKENDIPEVSAPADFTLTPQKLITTAAKRRDGIRVTIAGEFTTPASPIGHARITGVSGLLQASDPIPVRALLNAPLGDETSAIEQIVGDGVKLSQRGRRLAFSLRINLKTQGPLTTFAGQARVERRRPEKIAELPLRVGERLDRGSAQIVITDIRGTPRGDVELVLTRQRPNRTFTEKPQVEAALKDGAIVILNRRLKQGVLLRSSAFTATEAIRVLGIQRDRLTITLPLPLTSPTDAEAWLADATLCLIAEPAQDFFQVPVSFSVPPIAR